MLPSIGMVPTNVQAFISIKGSPVMSNGNVWAKFKEKERAVAKIT